MEKLIIVYLIFNGWLAGNHIEEALKKEYKNKRRKIISISANQIFMLLFGCIFFMVFLIVNQLIRLWNWIECTLQLKFWYRWNTGYYKEIPDESTMLYIKMKVAAYNKQKKLTWAESHFIYCAKVLFNKFNYDVTAQ
ncbi:MAG TPA: hypothetical protein VN922_19515 [Bacteroidia bacterium]|nr:hypothetical protein [Bacteroidia bacterium]